MASKGAAVSTWAEAILPISMASNLNMGLAMDHGMRSVWIGMRIGETMHLQDDDLVAIYFGGLLKDAG